MIGRYFTQNDTRYLYTITVPNTFSLVLAETSLEIKTYDHAHEPTPANTQICQRHSFVKINFASSTRLIAKV